MRTGINVKMRKSITMMRSPSKTRAQFASVRDTYKIPSYPKSPLEYEFITMALLENVMFSSLPEDSLDCLVDAFEITIATQDVVIVTQGELRQLRGKISSNLEGDYYVYLVGDGQCTVLVDGKVAPEPYGTLKPKAIFGELAVLYNQSRAATITAKTDTVTLFRVKGDTFKLILNHHQTIKDDQELLEKIDNVINQIAGTKSLYGGVIIRQYKSPRLWLWTRWKGTVLQHNYKTVLGNMMISVVLMMCIQYFSESDGKFGLLPDPSLTITKHLAVITKLWSYQATLTTFILTFFVNKAYSFWEDVYAVTRRIQGRLNDYHLLLATGAKRNRDGTYTRESEKLLDDVGAFSRLFHALYWASVARRFAVLRTLKGLERLAGRGLMTSQQLKVLASLDLPDNQRHNACLEWMMIRVWQGIDDGTLRNETSYSERLMDQLGRVRAEFATIGDMLAARMPLPYTHLVQILVDSFVLISPFALYPELGAYSVVSVGILTLFYTGLLDLAKVFLDPLDNEDFTKHSIDMDLGVLIRETNAGSTRWKNSGARLPFSARQPAVRPPPMPEDHRTAAPNGEHEQPTSNDRDSTRIRGVDFAGVAWEHRSDSSLL